MLSQSYPIGQILAPPCIPKSRNPKTRYKQAARSPPSSIHIRRHRLSGKYLSEPDSHKADGDSRICRIPSNSYNDSAEATALEWRLGNDWSKIQKKKSRPKRTGLGDNREWRVRFRDCAVCPPPDVAYASMRYTNTYTHLAYAMGTSRNLKHVENTADSLRRVG